VNPEVLLSLLGSVIATVALGFPFAELLGRVIRKSTKRDGAAAVSATTLSASSAERLATLAGQMEDAIAQARREVADNDEKREQLRAEAAEWEKRADEAKALVALTDEQTDAIRHIVSDAAREPLTVKLRWFVASVVGSAVLGAVLGVVLTAIFLN
jgi:hypothetical protein